jgi:hypothetical protein
MTSYSSTIKEGLFMRPMISVLLLMLGSLPLAGQNPWKFVTIDVPGATETWVRGVNNTGEVVGYYMLPTYTCPPYTTNDPQVPGCYVKSFKIINGVLTKLNVPGATGTAIMAVNDYGDLVGFYTKVTAGCPAGKAHGFLWLHTNVIKTLDFPGTGLCGSPVTVPMGINRAMTIAGMLWGKGGGFVWKNGVFHVMNVGGSGFGGIPESGVYGISNSGVLVGTTWAPSGLYPLWWGWLKKGPDEDFFQSTQDDTWATAVNNATDIAGYGPYGNAFFAKHIELNEGDNDTVEVQPLFINLMAGDHTYPFAMNDKRAVVGAYRNDATFWLVHGFMAAPTF